MRPTTANPRPNSRSRTGSSQEEQDLQQAWGAQLPPEKHPDNFRIFGLNIGGFSTQNPDKFNFLHSFISTYDPDVMCINETALLWHKLREDLRLDQRVREWWQGAKCVCSYNRTFDTSAETMKSGTAIIIRGNKANRVVQMGKDPSGLGRWSWVRIQGFGGKTLLIISAYRPVYNPTDDNSTYSQHASFFFEFRPDTYH
jgi:exonuclease III